MESALGKATALVVRPKQNHKTGEKWKNGVRKCTVEVKRSGRSTEHERYALLEDWERKTTGRREREVEGEGGKRRKREVKNNRVGEAGPGQHGSKCFL